MNEEPTGCSKIPSRKAAASEEANRTSSRTLTLERCENYVGWMFQQSTEHFRRMRPICHIYHQLRANTVRQYSTIHWENTQAVATTPVALRLLGLGGKRLVTRLLGLKGEWVRCRRVQP